MKKVFLGIILFILGNSLAFAETSIKAEVDKTSITSNDTLTYKIIITSDEKNLPVPAIPEFEGFAILSQAESSTASFSKGTAKISVVYVFILAPTQTGKLEIHPAVIKIGKLTLSTETLQIQVSRAETKPLAPPEKKPAQPQKPPLDSEEPQFSL